MREFARLPKPPSADEIAPEERDDYELVRERTDRVHGPGGPAAAYFGALLASPPLAAALTRLGTSVREGQLRGTYTDAERELMDLVLAAELGSNAILPIHVPDALAVGVRAAAVEAVLGARDDAGLTDDERELVEYARAFVYGAVTDGRYATMRERFGDRGAVEFTVLLGFLLMTIRLWQALGVPEPTEEDVGGLLAAVHDGSLELPDPDARIG